MSSKTIVAKANTVKKRTIACGAFFSMLLALSPCLPLSSISADTWVDDHVTEFNRDGKKLDEDGDPIEDEEPASDVTRPGNSVTTPPKYTQRSLPEDGSYYKRKNQPENTDKLPASESDADEGDETNGDSKRAQTNAPLEAKISTWSQGGHTPGTPIGLDKAAMRLLQRAPLLAPPRTINVSAKSFQAWLDQTHPGLRGKTSRDEIVEVKGQWDDAAHTLHTFGMPCTKVSVNKLGSMNLDKAKIVVVNCAGEVTNDAIISLRRFVEMGGYLLTTDWALTGVIQRAFPGYVEWNGGSTEDRLVDAVAVDPEDGELFAGTPRSAFWKLVKKSQMVKISRWGSVRVLARSRLLMREDPSEHGILAFLLEHGRGQVLHLVGHFDNNADLAFNTALPDPAPGMDLSFRQALAANFIARALGGVAPAAAAASAQGDSGDAGESQDDAGQKD
jgi:hypothetical protein